MLVEKLVQVVINLKNKIINLVWIIKYLKNCRNILINMQLKFIKMINKELHFNVAAYIINIVKLQF